MDFEQRLQKAIERGQRQKDDRSRQAAARELTEEEFRQLHSSARLELSDRIEQGLRQIADHFPGFRYSTLVGEDGWGGRITRDDFSVTAGGSKENLYSRLEMLVKSFSPAVKILELTAKGTVRNKEVISRTHFQFLNKLDLSGYRELIEQWMIEFVERYSAES